MELIRGLANQRLEVAQARSTGYLTTIWARWSTKPPRPAAACTPSGATLGLGAGSRT